MQILLQSTFVYKWRSEGVILEKGETKKVHIKENIFIT